MEEYLKNTADKFRIEKDLEDIRPLGGGLINSTYIVETAGDSPDYILQKKNKSIFPDIPAMMDNIVKVTEHIRKKVKETGGDPDRESMTVVMAEDGNPYVKDADGEFWTASVFISDTVSYDIANSTHLAYKGGEGIGKFQMQLADFKQPLFETIPGFHNIRYRFEQWDKAIRDNKAGRLSEVAKEVEAIERRRQDMLHFWKLVEDGVIPKRVTHNDTKISNILFDKNDNVLCVIDLDTVMSNTVLADYGDAIRTFANTGAEDDKNLDNVGLDLNMFEAYTRGYLSHTKSFLSDAELEYLPFGACYIVYEQVLRFLMDYIDGDTYYHIKYPEHNLVRTRAQAKLLESLEANYDKMRKLVDSSK